MRKRILFLLCIALLSGSIVYGLVLRSHYLHFKDSFPEPYGWRLFLDYEFFATDTVHSMFGPALPHEKRPVKWMINQRQLEVLDSFEMALINTSDESFHHPSWGTPFSRVREDMIVYRGDSIDSIPFDGFGCATDVFIAELGAGDTMRATFLNPFLRTYGWYGTVPLESDSFPIAFQAMFGDSVAVRYRLPTYSVGWNTYPSQMIQSEFMTVSTAALLNNWKQGKYVHWEYDSTGANLQLLE